MKTAILKLKIKLLIFMADILGISLLGLYYSYQTAVIGIIKRFKNKQLSKEDALEQIEKIIIDMSIGKLLDFDAKKLLGETK